MRVWPDLVARWLVEAQGHAVEQAPAQLHLGGDPGGCVGLVREPRRMGAHQQSILGHAIATRERHADELHRERPSGSRRHVRRDTGREVRGHDERTRPDGDERVCPPVEAPREGVVRQGTVRRDATDDDLRHRIRLDDVDPFERGNDGAFGDAQRRHRGRDPDVAAPFRRDAVGDEPQAGQGALAPGRCQVAVIEPRRRDRARAAIWRFPLRSVHPGVVESSGQFAPDRHLHAQDVEAGRRQGRGLVQGTAQAGFGECRAEPRLARLAEQRDELAASDPVGVDTIEGQRDEARRLGLGHRSPIRLAEQLGLQGEVDGAGCHVEGQLLRLDVVLEQGHRERQGDPATGRAGRTGRPAIDRRAGQRSAGAVEPRDPEQAQDRALLPERRGRPGARTPRAGQRVGALVESVEGGVVHQSIAEASRLRARKPRYAVIASSAWKRTPRSPWRSTPGTIAAKSARTARS